MLYVPSHHYPNLASLETNQDSLFLIFQLSHLLLGHLLNFLFLNLKITLGLKTPRIITGQSPPTILVWTEIKMQMLLTEPGWLHAFFFYIWGDFMWSRKQAIICTSKQNQNANLPKGDKGTIAIRR